MAELTSSTREAARRLGVSDTTLHKAERTECLWRCEVDKCKARVDSPKWQPPCQLNERANLEDLKIEEATPIGISLYCILRKQAAKIFP